MNKRKRAMSSEHASTVKIAGHVNEDDFAAIIGGEVNQGSHTDKKDVIDKQHRAHSVKAGTWWQVFLYGRQRLQNNTALRGIKGDIADIMIACLDAYPDAYETYKANKTAAKTRLQAPMQELLAKMEDDTIRAAFLEKSLFDGGNADYLSFYLGKGKDDLKDKIFHIFHKKDVIAILTKALEPRNSKAKREGQMDNQKVTFRSKHHNKNIGEIEDRHDSKGHYRQMKFRLKGQMVYDILEKSLSQATLNAQVIVYGEAIKRFKL